MSKRILAVAESDSSGLSGLQVDIKTVHALGGYAMTAVSLVTAQNAQGIRRSQKIDPDCLADQMRAVMEDPGVNGIKIGFLENTAAVNAVAEVLDKYQGKGIPVVVDPSIVSRKGDVLVDDSAIAAWKRRLYIHARVLTPNLKEAELLSGMKIPDMEALLHAADMMRTLGVENIVLKAGKFSGHHEQYIVATDKETRIYERATMNTQHTLGAGSAFSTALTVGLTRNMDVFSAVEMALDFLHRAMADSPKYTQPAGALNYTFSLNEDAFSYKPGVADFQKL